MLEISFGTILPRFKLLDRYCKRLALMGIPAFEGFMSETAEVGYKIAFMMNSAKHFAWLFL